MAGSPVAGPERGWSGRGVVGPGVAGTGVVGPGVAGTGVVGPGVAGTGVVGPGVAGTVVVGPGMAGRGVAGAIKPGALYIDFSTIRPETSIKVAKELTGVRVLDAPVSGGEQGAKDAVLSIMVGGTEQDFAAAIPIFEAVGRTFRRVGPNGAGQYVKAANQLVVGGTYALVAEAIVLMEAAGVDAAAGLDVLAGGLAASRILDLKRASMLAREFAPGFRIDLHHKDMGIVTAAARGAEVALPMSALVAQLVAAARSMGYGSLDHSALLKVVETLSGRDK